MPSFFVAYSAIELHIPPKSLPILPELSRFFPLLFMPLINGPLGTALNAFRQGADLPGSLSSLPAGPHRNGCLPRGPRRTKA